MTTTAPRRVSVVVPTCNRPEYLRQALASIRALEGDAYSFEILVGDNGSAPATRDVADEFGAVYIKVERTGAGAARNAGLAAATGDYIAFLDDDDVWLPTHLHRHFEILDERPDVEAVIGQVISTDAELRPLDAPWPHDLPDSGDDILRVMLRGFYPQIGGTVARASVRDTIGFFDEALLGDQDWDWQLRIARRRTLAFANSPCVLFRQRAPGSFDALRLRRVRFARRVFFRHALPERSTLDSARGLAQAYRSALQQHYDYFVAAALSRAESGDRKAVLGAIGGAFRVFPLRAAYHLLAPRDLRKAFFASVFNRAQANSGPSNSSIPGSSSRFHHD